MSENQTPKLSSNDLEYVTSASQARLLYAPKGASLLILTITFLAVALLSWAAISKIDEVVKAQGKVVPSAHVQIIQSLEGGILESLAVVEGQVVKKGQALLQIDDTSALSLLGEQNVNRYALQAKADRLNALINADQIVRYSDELNDFPDLKVHETDLFQNHIQERNAKLRQLEIEVESARNDLLSAKTEFNSLRSNLSLAKQQLALNKKAADGGVISQVDYLAEQRKYNEVLNKVNTTRILIQTQSGKVNEAEKKLEEFVKNDKSKLLEERSEVETKLSALKAKSASAEEQLARTDIKAPIDGVVKKIYINTIGGVIKPGEPILEVVPSEENLLIEVKVKPKDIGFIRPELAAMVKVTAYDFSKFGGLDGKVEYVSPDSTTDAKDRSFYTVRIRTQNNSLADKSGREYSIIPGMQTEVNIVVAETSVLNYIFEPLLK